MATQVQIGAVDELVAAAEQYLQAHRKMAFQHVIYRLRTELDQALQKVVHSHAAKPKREPAQSCAACG